MTIFTILCHCSLFSAITLMFRKFNSVFSSGSWKSALCTRVLSMSRFSVVTIVALFRPRNFLCPSGIWKKYRIALRAGVFSFIRRTCPNIFHRALVISISRAVWTSSCCTTQRFLSCGGRTHRLLQDFFRPALSKTRVHEL